jgi:hypothetical protein
MKKFFFFSFISLLTCVQVYAQFTETYSRTSTTMEIISAIGTDAGSNVYVTGVSYDFSSSPFVPIMVTIKYDTDGHQVWDGSVLDSNVTPNAMVIDDSGNVYIAGYKNNGSNKDFYTIKYNTDGNLQSGWPKTINNGGDDEATAIALDDNGNVYVTGYSYVNHRYGSNYDMVTVAYHHNGSQIWSAPNYFDMPAQNYAPCKGDDYSYAIATYTGSVEGTYDAVFICGKSFMVDTIGYAYMTVQISLDTGNLDWYSFYKYDDSGAGDAAAYSIAVSQLTGKVYTAGYKTKPTSGNLDCIAMQNIWGLHSECGHECEDWCASYPDDEGSDLCGYAPLPDYGSDIGRSISIIDASSPSNIQIYVAGYTHTAFDPTSGYYQASGSDYLVLKYNGGSACDPEHYQPTAVFTRDGTNNNDDYANSVCNDGSNVYVTGTSWNTTTGKDIVTLKFDNDLNLSQTFTFNGTDSTGDEGTAVRVSGNYLYVGGTTNIPINLNTHSDFVTLQYSNSSDNPGYLSAHHEIDPNAPKVFSLSQNYPNPFNPVTDIRYSIPIQSVVSIKVYDILGREIANLVNNESQQPGYYKVSLNGTNLASGLYFYRMTAGSYSGVRKMILIK